MAKVKILITGYTSADQPSGLGEAEKTCPTITLIQSGELVIVVDPGVLINQQMLVDQLKTENLTVSDVNLVFITHSHLDHYRNIGMFPVAKTLEFWGIWFGNEVTDRPQQLSSDIEIMSTPGHSLDSLTLLVTTDQGRIAICGDVFWKEGLPLKDPYAQDLVALEKSRQKVLEKADWIIPGHGPMFKV